MTPRGVKRRFCQPFTGDTFFKPRAIGLNELEILELGHDEIEAMRLCDFEGLEQEEAADMMSISRGTVQRLLYSGRKKIIEAIIMSKALQIKGGDHIVAPSFRGKGRGRCGNGWGGRS